MVDISTALPFVCRPKEVCMVNIILRGSSFEVLLWRHSNFQVSCNSLRRNASLVTDVVTRMQIAILDDLCAVSIAQARTDVWLIKNRRTLLGSSSASSLAIQLTEHAACLSMQGWYIEHVGLAIWLWLLLLLLLHRQRVTRLCFWALLWYCWLLFFFSSCIK